MPLRVETVSKEINDWTEQTVEDGRHVVLET